MTGALVGLSAGITHLIGAFVGTAGSKGAFVGAVGGSNGDLVGRPGAGMSGYLPTGALVG